MISPAFEDSVLACLLKSGEFCTVAGRNLKATYFDTPVKHNIAKLSIDFFKRYGTKMSPMGFTEGVKDLVLKKVISDKDITLYAAEYKRLLAIDVSDWKFILEKLITFIKHKEMKLLIEEAVTKHLPKDNFTEIEKRMREISNISMRGEVNAYEYLSEKNIDERTKQREYEAAHKTYGISTGIKRMDDLLPKKGWYKRELYTIIAPPKRGKTMGLQYFANAAMMQGFKTAIFTLEVSTEVYCDRMDAMNSDIAIKELPTRILEAQARLKAKASTAGDGKMFIFEYPTKRLTADEIERQLRRLEIEQGITIDILFVDYGDIMKPNKHYEDRLTEQATIFEDLRGIASVFDIPVVTASQVNRIGSGKEIIAGKDVSGSWEKIMISDAIISFSASDAEMGRGEMKIHFAECRNMPSATIKIKTAYNYGKFFKEFISMDDESA